MLERHSMDISPKSMSRSFADMCEVWSRTTCGVEVALVTHSLTLGLACGKREGRVSC